NCAGLTSITIPGGVTSIGDSAFQSCTGLTSITILGGVTYIGDSAFQSCTGLTSITILGGVTYIGNSAFSNCAGLTSITIPGGVTYIGNSAFALCTGLTSITIPGSVTSIGDYAFQECTGLASVTLSESLKSIGDYAFLGCTGLASVTFPASVTSIGYAAFQDCTGLASVTLSESLKSIGDYAFQGCARLAGVTFPASVTSIGYAAFQDCTRLMIIIFRGNAPSMGSNVFRAASSSLYLITAAQSTGFTFPAWQNLPAVRLSDSGPPFVLMEDKTVLGRGAGYDFGSKLTGSTTSRVLCILNTSGVPQNFSKTSSAALTLDASSVTGPLAPWAAAFLTVSFKPSESGRVSALIDITGNGPGQATHHLTLTGAGVTLLELAQSAYLKASNPGGGDSFGAGIAVSGNTVVIAAPNEDSSAAEEGDSLSDSGAVYVFVKSGAGWRQEARLQASNAGSGDLFGSSVAIDGDTIIVGASGESGSASGINGDQSDNLTQSSGAAYLFTRNGTVWTQSAYLKASKPGAYAGFGYAVSISGDILAVGASREGSSASGVNGNETGSGAPNSGAVYLFARSGGIWTQSAYLKASNPGNEDRFGKKISISDGTVVVAAPGESSNATGVNGDQTSNSLAGAGAVYVFVKNDGHWTQQAYLKASNTGAGDNFGQSVGISGDRLIVGASGEDSSAAGINGDQTDNKATDSGAAYIFIRTGSAWSQQAYLKGAGVTGRFGWSAAISGDIAVVGADQEAGRTGTVRVFQWTGSGWFQQARLAASNAGSSDLFGSSVSVSGHTLATGAISESSSARGVDGNQSDNQTYNAGAAYLFEIGLRPSAPVFTLQPPAEQKVISGKAVTLSADAQGIPAPMFQWYRGNSGDTSSPLTGLNWKILTTATAGTYWVRATNTEGRADSATVSVSTFSGTPVEQWRVTNFGSPENSGAAADTSDPDGDGIPNLDEFTAGTVPTDRTDAFRILSGAASITGDAFTVTVSGKTGRSYQLVRSENPGTAPWTPVVTVGPISAPEVLELTDPAAPADRAFYRVVVALP
ncbi:MAG: leucine-rich repeat protein, partial [Verrucomicrobiota bacterium]